MNTKIRSAAILLFSLASLTTATVASAHPAAPTPTAYVSHPNWTEGSDSTRNTTAATPLTSWSCHGHADTPYTLTISGKTGVGYSGWQDCTGGFNLQKVCVQLGYLDYYGNPHNISTLQCGAETVAAHATFGRSLTCAAIDEGHVRYFTTAVTHAYPDGVDHEASGTSDSAYLC